MRISDWSSDVCSADLSGVLRIAAAGIEQQAAAVGKYELGLSGQRLDILARLTADADSGAVEKGLAEESGEGDGAAIIGRAAKGPAGRTETGAIFIIPGLEVAPVEIVLLPQVLRSEEQRAGTACISTCRARRSQLQSQKQTLYRAHLKDK